MEPMTFSLDSSTDNEVVLEPTKLYLSKTTSRKNKPAAIIHTVGDVLCVTQITKKTLPMYSLLLASATYVDIAFNNYAYIWTTKNRVIVNKMVLLNPTGTYYEYVKDSWEPLDVKSFENIDKYFKTRDLIK